MKRLRPELLRTPAEGEQGDESAPYRYFLFSIGAQAPVGQFNRPTEVVVGPDGTVYVADTGNSRIQRFSPTGSFLGTWGSQGAGDGQFHEPWGVAVGPDGTVYVADALNYRIQAFGEDYPAVWRGEYFGNQWLAERPLLIQETSTIAFDWGSGSPGEGLPSDFFSARWQRYLHVDVAGPHLFRVFADDGVRLWVDGRLLVDEWRHPQRTTFGRGFWLAAGDHAVRLEYYEGKKLASVSLQVSVVRGYLPLVMREW